jgi:hypothetical protein
LCHLHEFACLQSSFTDRYIPQAAAGKLVFSWCTGANVLAEAGVIDDTPATAHWGDIDRLERTYPQVQWQRGVRYVDAERVLTTGGVTSGVDGTLYLLGKLHGPEVAERVARALRYQPTVELDSTPTVEQYTVGPAESIILLNAAFKWDKRELGVWLYDGVGDLELAAVLDAYPPTMSARTYTVATTREILTSQYGLQLVPHWGVNALPAIERMLVPGGPNAAAMNASLQAAEGRITAPITRIHDGEAQRTAFESPLEDVAREAASAAGLTIARATLVMLRPRSLGLPPLSPVEGAQIRPIQVGEEGRTQLPLTPIGGHLPRGLCRETPLHRGHLGRRCGERLASRRPPAQERPVLVLPMGASLSNGRSRA